MVMYAMVRSRFRMALGERFLVTIPTCDVGFAIHCFVDFFFRVVLLPLFCMVTCKVSFWTQNTELLWVV